MKLRHERPMPELAYEVAAPLRLSLPDGDSLGVTRWSLAGFRVPGDVDVFPTHGTVSIPFQGVDVAFPVKWGKPKDGFCHWENLTGRQREAMGVFYQSLLSGKMASTEDMITALDTPVDLVPMSETDDEKEQGTKGKAPRSLRVVLNSAMYFIAAVVIFGFLATQIWSRVSGVNIQHARIEAPFHSVIVNNQAYVDRVNVAVGDTVSLGDVLARMSDPKGESRLDDIRGDIKRMERRIAEVDRELEKVAQERARIISFAKGNAELASQLDKREIELRRQRADLNWDLRRLRRDRGNQADLARAHDLTAPVSGIVRDVAILPDQFMARGATAITVEEHSARMVRGWVTDARAASLYPGMKASVTANIQGKRQSLPAIIERIEAGTDPALPGQYGLIVWARLTDVSLEETRTLFLPNMPVRLTAKRNFGF